MSDSTDLHRMARWLEIEWSENQRELFRRYQSWLVEEAIPAGGLGPREASRIFDRHIADSLAFVKLIGKDAGTLLDVGSGVGLPGIPIAIARRGLHVTVVDRSERRSRLAGRAVRILGLDNVTVLSRDVEDLVEEFDIITFRASLPIDPAITVFRRLAEERGEGLFAWSRTNSPIDVPAAPPDTIFTIVSEGDGVLDSPAWFLRMQRNRST